MRCKTEKLAITMMISLLLLLITTSAFAEVITFEDNWGEAGFNLVNQDVSGVEIVFSIPELTIIDQQIDGETMQFVQIPGVYLPNNAGAPDLPGAGRYVAIPQGAAVNFQIIATQTEIYQNLNIIPAPPIPLETDDSPLVYVKDSDIYSVDAYYPENPVLLSEETKMRGVDVVILGITPFQYNPVKRELIVYRDIRVRVDFIGGNGHFGEDRLRSRYWDPILSQHLINYQSLPQVDYNRHSVSDEDNCEYLIIIPDDPLYSAWADTIKQWRNLQGIITGITPLSEIGGNNSTLISNYLINAYYTWDIPPVAVLLLSDVQGASGIASPTWSNYCLSDNMYADMNADNLPDFAIGRISVQDEAHLATTVNKLLNYERTPPTDPNFYDNPVIAGGWQDDRWFILCTDIIYGYFENEQNKHPVREYAICSGNPGVLWSTNSNTGTIVNYFGPNGLGYIPATPEHLLDWGGNASRINADINSGAFLVQHRDHGYEEGWGDPMYNIGSLSGLSNNQLPFVFSTNCCTGNFGYSPQCFAEAFHNMDHGALGVNAASEVSYSFVNDTYQWGVYDSMWPDFDPGYGSDPVGFENQRTCFANASGKIYLSVSNWPYNTGNKVHTYNLFHHFGDAFTTLYSEVPQTMSVSHSPVLFTGLTSFTVTADLGAIIALTVNDEVIAVEEGTGGPLPITIEPQLPGSDMIVTVTKPNYYRYQESVSIVTLQDNYVIFYALSINDASGNNNQMLDLGETVLLSIAVENLGTIAANNIDVTISSDDLNVAISDDFETFALIPSGGRAFVEDGYAVEALGEIPDNHNVEFTMTATDGDSIWTSTFFITAHSPVVQYEDLFVDDFIGGNGDNHFDPGETVDLAITVENNGSGDSEDLTVILSCVDPLITIPNPSVTLNELNSSAQDIITFTDVFASQMLAQGTVLDFTLEITALSGYADTVGFTILFGDERRNPIGPDDYGYWAYDLYDGEHAPSYDWLEIAPMAGGSGTDLGVGNNSYTVTYLPFSFQFYGVEYDMISVASHGWLEFGQTETFYPNNMPIPHSVPPNKMVAAFWDDLAPGNYGQVASYHDMDNDRFIIEWYQVPHESDPLSYETFQIQLLDPAAYPTLSGDGEIVVMYNMMSDLVDNCSIGIEDGDGAIGIQFLYSGNYDELAMPLENTFAIKYSTIEPPYVVESLEAQTPPTEFSLGQNYPNPFNPVTAISYQLPASSIVKLGIYDVQGRLVSTLVNGWQNAGSYEVNFDASGLASGIYIYHIEAGDFIASGKMVLMK